MISFKFGPYYFDLDSYLFTISFEIDKYSETDITHREVDQMLKKLRFLYVSIIFQLNLEKHG